VSTVGVIFLHRISDSRVSGVTRRNFNLFRSLCGDENLRQVIITTNMWGQVDPEVGAARELELATDDMFLKPALAQGAQMIRYYQTLESAYTILRSLKGNQPMTLQIQRELVLEGKDISETAAGQELDQELVELSKKHKGQLTQIQQEMATALMEKDMQAEQELEEARDELLLEIRKNDEERATLASSYARNKEQMTLQLAILQASLRADFVARRRDRVALTEARRSQVDQAAEHAAAREMLRRQIDEVQRRQGQRGPQAGAWSPMMSLIIPAVAILAMFL